MLHGEPPSLCDSCVRHDNPGNVHRDCKIEWHVDSWCFGNGLVSARSVAFRNSDVLRADDVVPDTVLRLQEDGSESLMKRVW